MTSRPDEAGTSAPVDAGTAPADPGTTGSTDPAAGSVPTTGTLGRERSAVDGRPVAPPVEAPDRETAVDGPRPPVAADRPGSGATSGEDRGAPGPGAPPAQDVAAAPPATSRQAAVLAVVVGVLVASLYTLHSWAQWQAFAVRSWDLGIFTQLAARYAALEAPVVTIKGEGYNLLGDHFHPLLALLGPVYSLAPSAFTLLVVQDVLLGVSAAVVTHAAVPLLGRLVGALVGVAAGLSWGLQHAVEAQFHEVAFAVPLLALALWGVLRERWRTAVVAGALLVLVKEDLGLTTAVLGLVLAWRARRWRYLWLTAWGVAAFLLATRVVLPALNPDGEWEYGTRVDVLARLADPVALYEPAKGYTVWLLVVVTGAIALRSPFVLVAVPTLGWRFLSEESGHWAPTWHYSAVLMPIAYLAMLDGIDRARRTGPRWLRRYARQAPTVGLTASLVLLPQWPLWHLTNPGLHFPTARAEAARAALDAVPPGVTVVSDVGLMSYLVDTTDVHWMGNPNPVPDYLVIDRISGGTPSEWGDVVQVASLLHPGEPFELVHAEQGYEVARRVDVRD